MPAPLTATTALSGSQAASSSVPARGSTASAAASLVARDSDAASLADAPDSQDAPALLLAVQDSLVAPESEYHEASPVVTFAAEQLHADSPVAAFAAVVDQFVVVVDMAADTAKFHP
jgi:hypothetical protein